MSSTIVTATAADSKALSQLVNSAYRGESSRQGWTTEADLLDGQRTDEISLEKMIAQPGNTILVYRDAEKNLLGCVYLQQKQVTVYLGMLTVSPSLQGRGIGKELLAASELHARKAGCRSITMTVISIRHELIDWYKRHGYRETGETQPFPADPAFGLPRQALEFIVLEKELAAA